MRCAWISLIALLAAGCGGRIGAPDPPPAPLSGYAYQSEATRALQDDPFANPGLLWVDRGRALFEAPAGARGRACAGCHADGLSGAAARLPRVDPDTGDLLNVELAINRCRTGRQGLPALAWESEPLLALTAFVASRSNGMPFDVRIDGAARPHWEAGRRYFYARRGQLNLACHHCHERNVGRKLRGDTISQGQPVGYPAYRFEWESLGSLHRRLQFCNAGVRAQPYAGGHPVYLDLELYLAWRAGNLPFETPAVRR